MFGQPTTLTAILTALAERIVTQCSYDASQVFLSLFDDDDIAKFPTKETFIQIAPRDGTPRAGDVEGGGDELTTLDMTIAINLWLRLGLDVSYQDAVRLKHDSLGQIAKWHTLVDALQTYFPAPTTSGGSTIFAEPMRLTRFEFRPRKPIHGWAKMPTWWKVPFVLNLT